MTKKKLTIEDCDERMATKTSDSTGLVWFDATEAPIELSGFAWFDQDRVYRRMPVNPAYKLPGGVDFLAWHTSGGKIRFKTDSKQIVVRVKLRENGIMDHMARTGSNGFDVYCGAPGKETYFYTTRTCDQEYDFQLFRQPTEKMDTFTINFPLYQGVNELQIGLEQGAKLLPPEPLKKAVVIYGTSITQGGCASRPGMVTSNILSRKLGRHFINLGFSGSGRGEPEVARVIAELDPAMFLLDFEANAWNDYDTKLPEFVRILRETHPETPIFILSRYHYSKRQIPEETRCPINNRAQQKLVKAMQQAGDKNIWSVDGRKQLGKYGAAATVDGVHATDLGFTLQSESLLSRLRKILAGKA
ncbi:MAG: SGNH/GDSL hydrolase family protein [Lentisphaeria bacterium]|nr:SGNH/GDSL hydrolase family protein [Lentisphaeria bacterium]